MLLLGFVYSNTLSGNDAERGVNRILIVSRQRHHFRGVRR